MVNFILMLNHFDPIVNATITFLKLLKVKVSKFTINETLQNHPDWPGILCITDSLTKWNIPNGVGKVEVVDIDQLQTPFIAFMNISEYSFAVVTQVTKDSIQYYSKDYKKPITTKRDEFLKQWNGIFLIAEPSSNSGETKYKQIRINHFILTLPPLAVTFLLIIFSSFLLLDNTNLLNQFPLIFQYLIFLFGIIITTLLLWYEIDKNNPFLKKVCTGISKSDCSAILTDKASKLFSWLSWSEVGFFYFTGGLLNLIFVANSLNIISWINIFALPYILFSIFYQGYVAKQWCVLCLSVQALLLLGVINVIFNSQFLIQTESTILFFSKIISMYTLPVLLWYTVKPYILKLQSAKQIKREYLRIKFNNQIFETLLLKQKEVKFPSDNIGIDIGNKSG